MLKQFPAPRFKRFERVRIRGERPQSKQYEGEQGVVIWLDSFYTRKHPEQPDMWMYSTRPADQVLGAAGRLKSRPKSGRDFYACDFLASPRQSP
jgi:hypothetical protein